jgi:hypothetical protein
LPAGPDRNLWFTEQTGNRIGRITTDGVVTELSGGVSAGARPRGIAVGPDGNLWFTEATGGRIGRMTLTVFGPVETPGGCAMVQGVQDENPDPTLLVLLLIALLGMCSPGGRSRGVRHSTR